MQDSGRPYHFPHGKKAPHGSSKWMPEIIKNAPLNITLKFTKKYKSEEKNLAYGRN